MITNPLFTGEYRKNQISGTYNKAQATAGKPDVDKCLLWENTFLGKTAPSAIVREATVNSYRN